MELEESLEPIGSLKRKDSKKASRKNWMTQFLNETFNIQ